MGGAEFVDGRTTFNDAAKPVVDTGDTVTPEVPV